MKIKGEKKLKKNNLVGLLFGFILVGLLFGFTLLGSVTIAQAATIGPVWPAPDGTSYAASGDMGFTGGHENLFSL